MPKRWVICELCSGTVRRGDADAHEPPIVASRPCRSCRASLGQAEQPAKRRRRSTTAPRPKKAWHTCARCVERMATVFRLTDDPLAPPLCVRCYHALGGGEQNPTGRQGKTM